MSEAWKAAPVLTATSLVFGTVVALIPAGQVTAIAELVSRAEAGEPAMVQLVVLALLLGLGQVSTPMASFLSQRLAFRQGLRQQQHLLGSISRVSPQRLATAETNATIQACRGALFEIAGHNISVENAFRGLVAAVGVCAAVWRIDLLAGFLVVGALVPLLINFAWAARQQDKTWVPVGEERRWVGYATEQLVFQRTGTELATLGSAPRMAAIADQHQRRANTMLERLFNKPFVGDAITAVITALLLSGALASLLASDARGAGIAAGVVGVLAGAAATSSAGYALGDLLTTGPKVARFRDFCDNADDEPQDRIESHVDELRATGITVTYPGTEQPAVVEAGIRVRRGEMIALVGVNGAGKTTVVNAVLGIVDAEAGQVLIDGEDASTMSPQRRLSHFGLLTQEFGRYELTVRDAVHLGIPERDVSDDEVWAALKAARVDTLVGKLPDGLDTQLGQQWGGVGLSGGQWQRIALARIYLRNAAVWVLDEPTSAIDAEAEQEIFDELHRGKDNRITIVVSHRAWTLRRMDRIYVFDEGHIVESGTYRELLAAGGRFSQIFAEQADESAPLEQAEAGPILDPAAEPTRL
ncbi:ATP-binding cassette domain-containing protein [Occultella kanbiaonis]|uniref:ATP-binding cassette domain-containing protein n=1 Tax=Occultella kanbiaonis TaxID=2675754 RepID=UPI0013D0462C|nr:ABC transporter ATP-binding protein [Occultella kanbiaonis]